MSGSETSQNTAHSRPRVLFISLESRNWRDASHWPYDSNLCFEEGFKANGMDWFTIPAQSIYETTSPPEITWLSHIKQICTGKQFDQVWMEIVHSHIDNAVMEWLATIAPVRVGLVVESMDMDPRELTQNAVVANARKDNLGKHLEYMTHVIAVDELDVARLNKRGIPTMWMWNGGTMPKRFISDQPARPTNAPALVDRALYGDRARWLENPTVRELLVRPLDSPEDGAEFPALFDQLSHAAHEHLTRGLPVDANTLTCYMDNMRRIRQKAFDLWLDGLRAGSAVVNLPQFGQIYASRVIEGMAAGRVVISWEIPNRPAMKKLFEDGREILLYNPEDPQQLADHIHHVQLDPKFARRVAARALDKLRDRHNTERLVGNALAWIEGQERPGTRKDGPDRQMPALPELHAQVPQAKANIVDDGSAVPIQPGHLVFDIGANVGGKADGFLKMGASVVCVEPQPQCSNQLHQKYDNNQRVTLVQKALGAQPGTMQMMVCSEAPTISTLSRRWTTGRFASYSWNQSINVEVTTLDQLIRTHGRPFYCKIDVEGFEYEVLSGLSSQIPYLSFEFTIEFLDNAKRSVAHLHDLGYREFSCCLGEDPNLAAIGWVTADQLIAFLQNTKDPMLWGDIYARSTSNQPAPSKNGSSPSVETQNHHSPQVAQTATNFSVVSLARLKSLDVWKEGQPLRLHLGCGEQHLDAYVNIDYPPAEHTVQTHVAADLFADITAISFPPSTVDEIRLSHVFEHFDRPTALAQVIRWHLWLKPSGRLVIETPDIMGCSIALTSDLPYSEKQAILRHAFGSHEAAWACHLDGWYDTKFSVVLGKMGFSVTCEHTKWPQPPHLPNVTATAIKQSSMSISDLLSAADNILLSSMVADVPSERRMHEVWSSRVRQQVSSTSPDVTPAIAAIPIHVNSPEFFDSGYEDDSSETNGEYNLLSRIVSPGSTVFDVGANKGSWSQRLLSLVPSAQVHAFEPVPDNRAILEAALSGTGSRVYEFALSDRAGLRTFYHYDKSSEMAEMSSFYRRPSVEANLQMAPIPIRVMTATLNEFCSQHGIDVIHYLKIDTEGSEVDVLNGANILLTDQRVCALQFEYGGTYLDAGHTLNEAWHLLTGFGYSLFRILPDSLLFIPIWEASLENFRYANYVALSPATRRLVYHSEDGCRRLTPPSAEADTRLAGAMRGIDAIQRAIDDNPQDINNYLMAAQALLNKGEFDSASRYLEDAEELDSSNRKLRELLSLMKNHGSQERQA